MQLLVTATVLDTITLDEDRRLRNEVVGPRLPQIMDSGKVLSSGIFCNKRGGFFLMDVDDMAELYVLLGPEFYANFEVVVQPILPIEMVVELFQKWASEGR